MSPPLPREQSEQKLKTSDKERQRVKNGAVDGERVKLTCTNCKKEYWNRASHEDRSKFCSLKCRKEAPIKRKADEMAKLMAQTELTPAQSAKIRGQIANYVRDQITDAHQVVMGGKEWNQTQARWF